MKKTLLSVAFLLSAYFSVNAQQNISFETSEGYTTGGLFGQNGWLVIDDSEGSTGSNAVVVSEEQHSAGTQSLKFVADEEDNNLYYDVFKTIATSGTTFTITLNFMYLQATLVAKQQYCLLWSILIMMELLK
jgi:hypothetical protein